VIQNYGPVAINKGVRSSLIDAYFYVDLNAASATFTTTSSNKYQLSSVDAGVRQYSANGVDWIDHTGSTSSGPTFTFSEPTTRVYFRGDWRNNSSSAYPGSVCNMFYENSSLVGIGGNLGALFSLDGITSTVPYMFKSTFEYSSITGELREGLTAGITGAPTERIFQYTFGNTSISIIHDDLFAGINGPVQPYSFAGAFVSSGITFIPSQLFSGITGPGAEGAFAGVFYECEQILSIPAGLFSDVSGAAAESEFEAAFSFCTNLQEINYPIFGAIEPTSDTTVYKHLFRRTCDGGQLDLISAPEDMRYLWSDGDIYSLTERYTGSESNNAFGHNSGVLSSGFIDKYAQYSTIPTTWGGSGSDVFYIDLSSAVTSFQSTTSTNYSLPAVSAGVRQYSVDGVTWSNHTASTTTAPTLSVSSTTRIYFRGDWRSNHATYPGSLAYMFYSKTNVVKFGGTLRALCGSGDTDYTVVNKMFYSFAQGCTGVTSIAPRLLHKMTGTPTSSLFAYMFYNNKIAALPPRLINGISGIAGPATELLFYGLLYGDTSLTSIPSGFFGSISGKPESNIFYNAFYGCTALTGLPDDLFAGFDSGCTAQGSAFYNMFYGCTGLISLPERLFAKIAATTGSGVFRSTFQTCTALTTVPGNILENLTSTDSSMMAYQMFYNCSGITSLPAIFANLEADATTYMFYRIFYGLSNCSYIAPGLFGSINATNDTVITVYQNAFQYLGETSSVTEIDAPVDPSMFWANGDTVSISQRYTGSSTNSMFSASTGTGWKTKYAGYASVPTNFK